MEQRATRIPPEIEWFVDRQQTKRISEHRRIMTRKGAVNFSTAPTSCTLVKNLKTGGKYVALRQELHKHAAREKKGRRMVADVRVLAKERIET